MILIMETMPLVALAVAAGVGSGMMLFQRMIEGVGQMVYLLLMQERILDFGSFFVQHSNLLSSYIFARVRKAPVTVFLAADCRRYSHVDVVTDSLFRLVQKKQIR